jgi:hypothetical protein
MEQLLSLTAVLVALGGLLTIVVVLGLPLAHNELVVVHLRTRLHRMDDVLAAWQHESGSGRRSLYPGR